ncbi:MAG: NTP transferase domain-containing protein [Candidatus Jidaibacter sp.]|jgi:MurNAc alpha-1-phosphate uridylyltransferase|nr:NTP transferase domain-containing protein [Candidatus Jidaibacter sp.]
MHNIGHALILSAGFGTRLRPITDNTPKALVEVDGVPMLDRIISQIKRSGINKIYVNSHYLSDKLHDHIKANHTDVVISFEPYILETGGGALKVMQDHNIDEMLIVNCDAFFDVENPFEDFLAHWSAQNLAMLMTKKVISNGDFGFDGEFVNTLNKDYKFLGVYIVSQRIYENKIVEKFGFAELLFKELNKTKHRIAGFEYQGFWLDIGSHESLRIAHSHGKQ